MARIPIEEYFTSTNTGRLTVVKEVEGISTKGNGTIRRALFRCECGQEVVILLKSVKSGATKSCGCWAAERASSLAEKTCLTHGDARSRDRAPEYGIYRAMLNRCLNPNVERYPAYGGRGISVADDWLGKGGYERFLAHVARRPSTEHSIDRIDPDGDYEPCNVRWAVEEVQANNKRSTVRVKVGQREMTLREMAQESGVGVSTLRYRMKGGMSPEAAMSERIKTGPNAKAT